MIVVMHEGRVQTPPKHTHPGLMAQLTPIYTLAWALPITWTHRVPLEAAFMLHSIPLMAPMIVTMHEWQLFGQVLEVRGLLGRRPTCIAAFHLTIVIVWAQQAHVHVHGHMQRRAHAYHAATLLAVGGMES